MRTNTRILVMLAVAAAVAAMPVWSNAQETLSTGAANTAHTIVVAGQGSVNDTPDQTSVTLGVETTKTTAQDAQNANSATMTEIIRQIAAVGIPADQMRTTGVELNPQRRPGPGNGQITGYTATNRIVVTVNDLRLTGRVIDAGVGAGANEVAGISFGLRDAKADQTRALRDQTGAASWGVIDIFGDLRRDLSGKIRADACDESGRDDRSRLHHKWRRWT